MKEEDYEWTPPENRRLPKGSGSVLQDMSGNPFFCFTSNSDKGLQVIQTE
jgi:hypothetical protein